MKSYLEDAMDFFNDALDFRNHQSVLKQGIYLEQKLACYLIHECTVTIREIDRLRRLVERLHDIIGVSWIPIWMQHFMTGVMRLCSQVCEKYRHLVPVEVY